MCGNLFGLVEIGGMLILRGGGVNVCVCGVGGGGLYVTCDAHFLTWPIYSSQKSCVKIWFGLVEAFKSYRGYKPNGPRMQSDKEQNHGHGRG